MTSQLDPAKYPLYKKDGNTTVKGKKNKKITKYLLKCQEFGCKEDPQSAEPRVPKITFFATP